LIKRHNHSVEQIRSTKVWLVPNITIFNDNNCLFVEFLEHVISLKHNFR